MKTVIDNTQNRLAEIDDLKHIDEDWGQLDYYGTNHPVKWPCVLLDVSSATFSDTGKDRTKTPQQRQMADCVLTVTVANLKLTNSSHLAPKLQKDQSRSIWSIIDDVHKKLHGWNSDTLAGKFLRRGQRRIKRDDGVQEYELTYVFEMTGV